MYSDVDMVELEIGVWDGTSCFQIRTYVGHTAFHDAVSSLRKFSNELHGGLLDIRFGAFGLEYGGGAFSARFHFAKPGRLYVSVELESDFSEFGRKNVACRASMFLKSEPALLDRFIDELTTVAYDATEDAHLEAI
jgi:hypothetical protein